MSLCERIPTPSSNAAWCFYSYWHHHYLSSSNFWKIYIGTTSLCYEILKIQRVCVPEKCSSAQ